jgi:hypothetical protein
MKKLALTCSMLLALVAFNAPDADAQVCLKFTAFCDGIQINGTTGGAIDADWYHFDCANSTPMTDGRRGGGGGDVVTSPCGGSANALINCTNCGGFGDWHFAVDGIADGTIDMGNGQYPNGVCWIDELGTTVQLGACTGLRLKGENQGNNRSSIQ